ncbi:hypothetical protein [Pseudidiomarina sp.]|uniref:hypothetical protein n=1 Tax=Pseudidiomarina sp. TaxID=2081707 RepID=UPI003A97CC9C
MALIQCPSCSKRVSDKATNCPHCDFKLTGLSGEELEREWQRVMASKRERLVGQSMLALLIAIAAFTYYFIQQPLPETWPAKVSYGLMIVGLIWFVINRVRLVFIKRKRS